MTPSKLLTVTAIGRNDSYMGNFKYRLTTSLNYLAYNLKNLGRLDDVELVVTDWNSDEPLSKVLPLSPEAASICRFIYVPPKVARSVQPPGTVFHNTRATNVALRRGQGKFLMLFDADCLISRYSLRTMLSLLDGSLPVPYDLEQTYFYCGRYQIPWEIVQRQPGLAEWDRYLLLNSGQLPPDPKPYGLGINGVGMMMHYSAWHECRGYNESMPGWGWSDGELALRVTQRYHWIDLASVGVTVFHMEHYSRTRRAVSSHAHNPHQVSPVFAANDKNWGLGDYSLEAQTAQNIILPPTEEINSADSSISKWDKTRTELLAELTGETVRRHLQNNITSSRVSATEWGSLYVLAWYSLYYYPRSYLEFGIRDLYAAAIVITACSGVEIYGLDSWQKDGQRPAPPPSFVTSMVESLGYRGYMRFVSGELKTAFRRLRDSSFDKLMLDLVLVRGDLFGEDTLNQLSDIVPHLAPGGALVFTCTSPDMFEATWNEMQVKFPRLTYWQCKKRNTGLALAVSLSEGESRQPLPQEETVLAAAWKRIIFSKSQLLIWQKRFQSVWEQLKYQSPRNWLNILQSRWTQFRDRWRVK